MIQLFQPTTGPEEAGAVQSVMASHWLGKGEKVLAFEKAWAAHTETQPTHMVSTTSCTQALFEAVRLAGVGPGDEVVIPTIHFVGAAQAVIAAGGEPIFCDVDENGNADTDTLQEVISIRTKAIILNAWGGMLPLVRYSSIPLSVKIIMDLACAPHFPVQKHVWDYVTWSFDSMKILTTGDGGMLWCRKEEDAALARMHFCLGVNTESGLASTSARWWEFNVPQPGHGRHMMNDIQAALGLEQLKRLPDLYARRTGVARQYDTFFRDGAYFMGRLSLFAPSESYLYFYPLLIEHGHKRNKLAQFLRAQGVYTSFRYWPLHWAYPGYSFPLPNAERFAQRVILLPMHANLTVEDVAYVCEKVHDFYTVNPLTPNVI